MPRYDQLVDRPAVGETNGLASGSQYHEERQAQGQIEEVSWTTPGLKVTRLRLLSDPGFPVWDVSYCHGMLDGLYVDVELPFSQLPKKAIVATILKHARREKVYAKGLGILDPFVISKLS